MRQSGVHGPRWSGGVSIDGKGYRLIYMPEHPRANVRGYVREHILVAEKALGKPLPEAAVVHHVNEEKACNRNSNLVICENSSYHQLLHVRLRIVLAGGDPNHQKICSDCGLQPRTLFRKQAKSNDGLFSKCRRCHSKRENARYAASKRNVA